MLYWPFLSLFFFFVLVFIIDHSWKTESEVVFKSDDDLMMNLVVDNDVSVYGCDVTVYTLDDSGLILMDDDDDIVCYKCDVGCFFSSFYVSKNMYWQKHMEIEYAKYNLSKSTAFKIESLPFI